MEWPPNPMILFTGWLMGQISNDEFIELSRLWKKKQEEKRQKEKAGE